MNPSSRMSLSVPPPASAIEDDMNRAGSSMSVDRMPSTKDVLVLDSATLERAMAPPDGISLFHILYHNFRPFRNVSPRSISICNFLHSKNWKSVRNLSQKCRSSSTSYHRTSCRVKLFSHSCTRGTTSESQSCKSGSMDRQIESIYVSSNVSIKS